MFRFVAARHRMSAHGAAMAVVGVALVAATLGLGKPTIVQQAAQEGSSASPEPAQVPLEFSDASGPAASAVPSDAARTQGADQQLATLKFDPRMGLPQWLRATHDVPLWSAADGAATSNGAL